VPLNRYLALIPFLPMDVRRFSDQIQDAAKTLRIEI
jgi:hypothetical protein